VRTTGAAPFSLGRLRLGRDDCAPVSEGRRRLGEIEDELILARSFVIEAHDEAIWNLTRPSPRGPVFEDIEPHEVVPAVLVAVARDPLAPQRRDQWRPWSPTSTYWTTGAGRYHNETRGHEDRGINQIRRHDHLRLASC